MKDEKECKDKSVKGANLSSSLVSSFRGLSSFILPPSSFTLLDNSTFRCLDELNQVLHFFGIRKLLLNLL